MPYIHVYYKNGDVFNRYTLLDVEDEENIDEEHIHWWALNRERTICRNVHTCRCVCVCVCVRV